jgi:hypothetical protein
MGNNLDNTEEMEQLAYSGRYHYNLKKANDDKVREQGQRINQALKQIRAASISSLPAIDEHSAGRPREDETIPHITLPKKDSKPDLKLVKVYEEACHKRNSEPPKKPKKILKKTKSWLPW